MHNIKTIKIVAQRAIRVQTSEPSEFETEPGAHKLHVAFLVADPC